jgi:hypothetical protein
MIQPGRAKVGRRFARPAWRTRSARVAFASALLSVSAWADETIEDPELSDVPREAPAAPHVEAGPKETIWRTSLHTRWGVDTHWVRPSQDVVEGTSVALVEAEQRRSDTLMFSVGLRARHGYSQRKDGDSRSELDVAPLSAFVDATPAEGIHFRVGYQQITMGTFDIFSASNFLSVYDLRSGPVTMPEAAAIAQPAVRFDLDRLRGFTLQTYYIPFFTPDVVTVYGSNYALWAPLDRSIDDSARNDPNPSVFGSPTSVAATRAQLERIFGRSGVSGATTNALRSLAPEPNLAQPQGAIRATLHGAAGELSATVGTALERLPAIYFSADPNAPIKVEHGRFGVASLEASTAIGPFQVGAEGAFMAHRTLIASRMAGLATGAPSPAASTALGAAVVGPVAPALSVPQRVNVAHAGLRAELLEAAGWAAEVEAFAATALSDPSQAQAAGGPPLQWFSMENGRLWRGVAGGVHFAPEASHLRLELGGMVFSGPSYVVMPRVEWEPVKTLFLEAGAVFVEGPVPTLAELAGSPTMSLGGLFTDVDQVFVGARWVP